MNAYKDMLDNVVSPVACVIMNHQNHLEQMAKGAMFATLADHQIDHRRSLLIEDICISLLCVTHQPQQLKLGN
jgi:hypothetical protein